MNVADKGADPTGVQDSTQVIQSTIDAARSSGQIVWIPPGNFTVTGHLLLDSVTIAGAGPWYSVLHGNGVGLYGNNAPGGSKSVQIRDLAIVGEVKIRDDSAQVNGIGGALSDSIVSNVWIRHTKCGCWLDGPFDNLLLSGLFIHDLTADGINFHKGVTNSVVEHTFVRNSGDDGLAMWSDQVADANNVFRFNTIHTPVLANNIAIYGGRDNAMVSNDVYDTLTQGGGLHVGNRFSSVPLAGVTTIFNNQVTRGGCLDPNWNFGVGALWFYALDQAMTGTINVTSNTLVANMYEAVHFIGSTVSNVHFDNLTITSASTFAFQFQCGGDATVANVVATDIGFFGQYNCGVPFKLTDGGGNVGWNSTHCGFPS